MDNNIHVKGKTTHTKHTLVESPFVPLFGNSLETHNREICFTLALSIFVGS